MIDALLFSRIMFSFFEATAVHCASDAATMVAYVGCCVGGGTGNHFPEHWRTKLQMLELFNDWGRRGYDDSVPGAKHTLPGIGLHDPYMVGKLAPNPTRSTRGLVKYVPGRGYFRAVPSQNGDKIVTSPPPLNH